MQQGLQPGQLILLAEIDCVKWRQLALDPQEEIDQPTAGKVDGGPVEAALSVW